MVRIVEVPGDKIEVHADIGPGRIVSARLVIDDAQLSHMQPVDPNSLPFEEWEKNFNEMLALAPLNEYPCDDSREAMYGPDPGEDGTA